MKIADSAWEAGHSTFFLEKVPFSVRNGPAYAAKLVDLFIKLISTGRLEPPYHVVEFGAGLGLLSYFFLKKLKTTRPDLYKTTTVWITDYSQKMIQTFHQNGLFKEFEAHARPLPHDAAVPFPEKITLSISTFYSIAFPRDTWHGRLKGFLRF